MIEPTLATEIVSWWLIETVQSLHKNSQNRLDREGRWNMKNLSKDTSWLEEENHHARVQQLDHTTTPWYFSVFTPTQLGTISGNENEQEDEIGICFDERNYMIRPIISACTYRQPWRLCSGWCAISRGLCATAPIELDKTSDMTGYFRCWLIYLCLVDHRRIVDNDSATGRLDGIVVGMLVGRWEP